MRTGTSPAPAFNRAEQEHRRQLADYAREVGERAFPNDGRERMQGPLPPAAYDPGSEPAQGTYEGEIIYLTGLGHYFWDGAQWRPLSGASLTFAGTWDPSTNGGGLTPGLSDTDGRAADTFYVAQTLAQYDTATGLTGSGPLWAVGDWAVKSGAGPYFQVAAGANMQALQGDTGQTSAAIVKLAGQGGLVTAATAAQVSLDTSALVQTVQSHPTIRGQSLVTTRSGQTVQLRGIDTDATLEAFIIDEDVRLRGRYVLVNLGAGSAVGSTVSNENIRLRTLRSLDQRLGITQTSDEVQFAMSFGPSKAGIMYRDPASGAYTLSFSSTSEWLPIEGFDSVGIADGVTVDLAQQHISFDHSGRYLVTYNVVARYPKKDQFLAFALYVDGTREPATFSGFSQTVEEEDSFSPVSMSFVVDVTAGTEIELWARSGEKDAETMVFANLNMSVVQQGVRESGGGGSGALHTYIQLAQGYVTPDAVNEYDIPGLTAIAIPGADGLKRYAVKLTAKHNSRTREILAYLGPNGNMNDAPAIAELATPTAALESVNTDRSCTVHFEIQPAANERIGFTIRGNGTREGSIAGSATVARSTLTIEELS